MKKLLILLIVLMSFNLVAGAHSQVATNVRIVEDTIWVATFIILTLVMYGFAGLSFGNVRTGYMLFILAGISGMLWKGIGLVKRVFDLKEPDIIMNVAREMFEGMTGVLLGIAFLYLGYSIYKFHAEMTSA